MNGEKEKPDGVACRAPRSLGEWEDWYETRTGEAFELVEGENILWHPQKGFASWALSRDELCIRQVAGDGRYWKDALTLLARSIGVHSASLWSARNPKSLIRRLGLKPKGDGWYELKDDGRPIRLPVFPWKG